MKRVFYNVNTTNGTNALNRAAQDYCKKFKGVEFPTSGDFFAFVKDLEAHIATLNAKYPKCTKLIVVGSTSGKSLNVNISGRVDSNVARMLMCYVTAEYTKENKYNSVINFDE